MSVYSGDFDVYSTKDTERTIGERNQIDFLIEYVAEIMLDHTNAFPENGMHNHNNNLSHQLKHFCIKIDHLKRTTEICSYPIASICAITQKPDYKYLFSDEIIPPPPKESQNA